MKTIFTTIKSHFPAYVKCQLNLDTGNFIEIDNQDKINTTVQYDVSFDNEGINIIEFDKISDGAIGKKGCFDVLVCNDTDIKYIELKNSINNNLNSIGNKFYYGFIKAKQFECFLSSQSQNIKFIVIYTNDSFIYPNSVSRDPIVQKQLLGLKSHIKAWNDSTIIVNPKIKGCIHTFFKNGLIPITKILYTGVPIELDNY